VSTNPSQHARLNALTAEVDLRAGNFTGFANQDLKPFRGASDF